MTDKEVQDELIFVGYTNGAQVLYANKERYGGQGAFFKTSEHECYIPLYMLRKHAHRLKSPAFKITVEDIVGAQKVQTN